MGHFEDIESVVCGREGLDAFSRAICDLQKWQFVLVGTHLRPVI
jgi:hypothetical protein